MSPATRRSGTPADGADAELRRARLGALSQRIETCTACPASSPGGTPSPAGHRPAFAGDDYWARPLPGFGDQAARLVVVGLAPAAHGGNRTGRMFTGDRSGDFLVAALHRHGFASQPTSRTAGDGLMLLDAYMTAPVRCAPPDNRPTPAERDTCIGYLDEELALLGDARVYLALGAFAYECLARLPALRAEIAPPAAPLRPRGRGAAHRDEQDDRLHLSPEPAQRLHRPVDRRDVRRRPQPVQASCSRSLRG